MKILFVTPRFPLPPIKGDKLRSYYFLKYLSKNHNIDLLSFIEQSKEIIYKDEMLKYCNSVETVLLPMHKSFLNMFLSMFSRLPFQVSYYRSAEMDNKIINRLSANKYDVIFIVLQRMMSYSKHFTDVPVVLDHIDTLSLNMERRYSQENNILKKFLFMLEYNKVKLYEKNNANKYRFCIVSSEIDKEALGEKNCYIIANGVDVNYFKEVETNEDIDVIFTGNLGYFPNIKAILYFVNDILPNIKKIFPNIKFYIVGANPVRSIRKLNDNVNIFVTGFVADIRNYLNRAKLFVAPLKSGSGIQNKILEAMACGVPVVTTDFGNGGINAEDGKELVIANDPLSFSNNVIELLQNENKRLHLKQHARILVEKKFCWEMQVKKLEELLKAKL
jgi:sugar transferase (PEP-CTERM/EpsH1 system associated)